MGIFQQLTGRRYNHPCQVSFIRKMFKLFFSDDKQSLLSANMRLEDAPE
jgi:hypothetical protein